jgi:hypothetical protein
MTSGLFGNEGQDPRAQAAAQEWQRSFGREGHEGSYALHHEAYQRYRQRHAEELDRDYEEWCRSHEQHFHRDFESFRSSRQTGMDGGLPPGAPMTNEPGDSSTLAEDRQSDTLVRAADIGEGR